MDPSQIQEDKENDTHSLEHSEGGDAPAAPEGSDTADAKPETSGDGKTATTDASGGTTKSSPAPAPKKDSFIKKLWYKFNIYLLLFILVVVLAVGILVVMTVKSRQAAETSIKTGELSPNTLAQLANSDVTVGDAKQVLTVQSNAIFAGAVLVRSNLEVAGTLKVGGKLSLTELQVSGLTQLADVTATNLTITGALSMQGPLALKNGINVTGNSNFSGNVTAASVTTGNLQLNGTLNLTHHITAGGTIPAAVRGTAVGGGGTISLNGSDTAGSITINTGSSPPAGCFVTVTFSEKFTSTPRVVITPIGSAAADINYYVDRTTTNFTICATNSAPAGESFGFDYIVLA